MSMDSERGSMQEQPQMEALKFPFDPEKVPKDMAGVMNDIKKLAESMLYHWSHFPIVLPSSITDDMDKEEKLNFNNLFKASTFDELEQVATTADGGLKKLSEKQLLSVWNKGEFEVASINFPGQVHRWRLTQLLQKGSNRAHDSLFQDIAISLRLMIITARNRFVSHFFSLSQSVQGLLKGFWKLIDIAIGMPSTSTGDLQTKIQDEHMRYLVAELDIKPNCKKDFDTFCNYVKEMCEKLQEQSSQQTAALRPPPIPYLFQTPNGLDIDLRLFNKDLINNCLPILSSILDRGRLGWHIQYRQKLVRDLQGKGLTSEEISKRVNAEVMAEYLDRIFNAICSNSELENLQPGIGNVLVDQAKAVLAMKKAVNNVKQKMATHRDQLLKHLEITYPVRSRIEAWKNEQIRAFESEFILQNVWSAHEDAISICEEQGLKQAVYFLKRDLNFIKERETVLIKELSKVRIPNRKYMFSMCIWFPSNYRVTKITGNKREVIPTVIVKTKPVKKMPLLKTSNIQYSVEKYQVRMTSSRYPFWRWWNYLQRTWTWMWNCLFFLGIVIPWCSPISFRALFFVKPFFPSKALSDVDGSLYPDESSRTQTMISRLTALWQHVRRSRKAFEDVPDRGFLGKSVTRHMNRIWNYVFKGAIGSTLIVLSFPLLCIVGSGLSVVLAVTTPVWIPVVTLLAHIAEFLIFDFDCPDDSNRISILLEAVIWRILIQGLLQPVAAMFTGCIVCPLVAAGFAVFGLVRRAGRGLWDTMMYYTLIRSRGRIPVSDGFVARRVAGPGLAADYFYQINPEQALAALEAKMELDELEAWKKQLIKQIEEPKGKYQFFVEQCFGPFSAGLVNTGVYSTLTKNTQSLLQDLTFKVQKRERLLNTGLLLNTKDKIKLPERELKLVILQGAKMLEKFYTERVFPKLVNNEEDFWEMTDLEFRDWRGLTSKKFSEIFSKGFLIPLNETDNLFELKVEHLNLSRYIGMLESGDLRDDLDLVTEVHSSNGEVSVKTPQLDLNYFDPNKVIMYTTRYQRSRSRSKPWKPKKSQAAFDYLQIPLPISHPAVVALSIYNREHEQSPNNLEDIYCQRIIRATKEVPYVELGESMMEEFIDIELSTPDNTIDPQNSLSHIAQQERTFSEENMAGLQSPARKEVRVVIHKSPEREGAVSHLDSFEGRVVYSETEKDTSCVVEIPE